MPGKYQLLAIDVDGTLIGPDQRIEPDLVDAIAAAETAGVRICLATGRSYVETLPVWRQLRLAGPHEPLILIGGALVSEVATGRTLYSRSIDRQLACEYSDALDEKGYSAMAIVDAWRWGVDYYLAVSADAGSASREWFAKMDVQVRRVRRLSEAQNMPEPLRINALVSPEDGPALAEAMKHRFDGRLNVHSIVAPNYGVTIVEAFDAGVDKAAAVKYVAQAYRVGASHVAAVGDDINDLTMMGAAGLGVAMPGGAEAVKDAADVVADNGLAAFITDLVAGRFD